VTLPPAAPPPSGIDVDLVPPAAPSDAGGGFRAPRLSRRELALFGIGAVAGSLVTFLGCLVALLARKPRTAPPPPDGEPPRHEGAP
jgi:hypothetical protein